MSMKDSFDNWANQSQTFIDDLSQRMFEEAIGASKTYQDALDYLYKLRASCVIPHDETLEYYAKSAMEDAVQLAIRKVIKRANDQLIQKEK